MTDTTENIIKIIIVNPALVSFKYKTKINTYVASKIHNIVLNILDRLTSFSYKGFGQK